MKIPSTKTYTLMKLVITIFISLVIFSDRSNAQVNPHDSWDTALLLPLKNTTQKEFTTMSNDDTNNEMILDDPICGGASIFGFKDFFAFVVNTSGIADDITFEFNNLTTDVEFQVEFLSSDTSIIYCTGLFEDAIFSVPNITPNDSVYLRIYDSEADQLDIGSLDIAAYSANAPLDPIPVSPYDSIETALDLPLKNETQKEFTTMSNDSTNNEMILNDPSCGFPEAGYQDFFFRSVNNTNVTETISFEIKNLDGITTFYVEFFNQDTVSLFCDFLFENAVFDMTNIAPGDTIYGRVHESQFDGLQIGSFDITAYSTNAPLDPIPVSPYDSIETALDLPLKNETQKEFTTMSNDSTNNEMILDDPSCGFPGFGYQDFFFRSVNNTNVTETISFEFENIGIPAVFYVEFFNQDTVSLFCDFLFENAVFDMTNVAPGDTIYGRVHEFEGDGLQIASFDIAVYSTNAPYTYDILETPLALPLTEASSLQPIEIDYNFANDESFPTAPTCVASLSEEKDIFAMAINDTGIANDITFLFTDVEPSSFRGQLVDTDLNQIACSTVFDNVAMLAPNVAAGDTIILRNFSAGIGTGTFKVAAYYANVILPVELSSFEAIAINDEAKLRWSTANEINNRGFEVLHSTDGKHWTILDFVTTEHTSSATLSEYSYTHETPASGSNYYKLKQIDVDGKESYSSIRSLSFSGIDNISFYPNPARDALRFTSTATYSIYNVSGEILLRGQSDEVEIQKLKSGVYILEIESQVHRFVKY